MTRCVIPTRQHSMWHSLCWWEVHGAAREPLITLTVMMMACWLVQRLLRCQKRIKVERNRVQWEQQGMQRVIQVHWPRCLILKMPSWCGLWVTNLSKSSGAGSIDSHLIQNAATKMPSLESGRRKGCHFLFKGTVRGVFHPLGGFYGSFWGARAFVATIARWTAIEKRFVSWWWINRLLEPKMFQPGHIRQGWWKLLVSWIMNGPKKEDSMDGTWRFARIDCFNRRRTGL